MSADLDIESFFGATPERPLDFSSVISGRNGRRLAERIVNHYHALQMNPPPPLEDPIPSILHFIWLGPNGLSTGMTDCIQSWQEQHPGWSTSVWRDEDIAQHTWWNQQALDYALRHGRYAMASDIVRLELLWQRGGFYADIDYLCLQNLNDLAQRFGLVCGASNTGCVEINNGIMGSCPRNPVLRTMMESIQSWFHKVHNPVQRMAQFLDPASKIALEQAMTFTKMDIIQNTGPGLITKCIGEVLSDSGTDQASQSSSSSIVVLPYHIFHPVPNTARETLQLDDRCWLQHYVQAETKAVHLWMCSWT